MSKFLIISLCIMLVATNPIPDNGETKIINALFNGQVVNNTMNGNASIITGDSQTAEGDIHVKHYHAGASHNQQGGKNYAGRALEGSPGSPRLHQYFRFCFIKLS